MDKLNDLIDSDLQNDIHDTWENFEVSFEIKTVNIVNITNTTNIANIINLVNIAKNLNLWLFQCYYFLNHKIFKLDLLYLLFQIHKNWSTLFVMDISENQWVNEMWNNEQPHDNYKSTGWWKS